MKVENQIKNYIVGFIEDVQDNEIYGCDLHNEIFNTDYFIIGTYEAEKWLEKNVGVLNAIRTIKFYEEDRFGEVYTDLTNAERICNMYVYIIGEEVLGEVECLRDRWDYILNDKDYSNILEELRW